MKFRFKAILVINSPDRPEIQFSVNYTDEDTDRLTLSQFARAYWNSYGPQTGQWVLERDYHAETEARNEDDYYPEDIHMFDSSPASPFYNPWDK